MARPLRALPPDDLADADADGARDTTMWAGGGSWEPSEPAPPPEPSRSGRPRGDWGPPERRGTAGVVPGRFLPLHRGHLLVIDAARASVEQLYVLVFTRPDDPIPGALRARWIRELYPDVTVTEIASTDEPSAPAAVAKLVHAVRHRPASPRYLFGSEPGYRAAATALSATFVPIDPARVTIPTSGTAIRANVMAQFGFLAPSARPWFVRRVAVVGAESTGKSTLCARLRAELRTPVVGEWTRVLAEAGAGTMRSEDVQLIARTQIATEDALARHADGDQPILVVDTELRTLRLWARRRYDGAPPAWIEDEIARRPYDLYLLCAPDIPFVGAPERDEPTARAKMHDDLVDALRGQRVVVLTGSRDERFQVAADAIIGLHAPTSLLGARGAVMR